jgi:hypothetical protein
MKTLMPYAATFSVLSPFIAVAILIYLPDYSPASSVLVLLGLILGITALVATRWHGREGIFWKAITGTCINGLLIVFVLISLPRLRREAESLKQSERQRMQQTQP